MANHRVGETGLTDSGPSNHHRHIPYAALHGMNVPTSFIHQEGSAFDFGELEEAIVLQGLKIRNDEAKAPLFTPSRPAATLEMFPSWPMRFQQTPRGISRSGGESTDSGSAVNTLSSKTEHQIEPESPNSKKASSSDHQAFDQKPLQHQQHLQQQQQHQQQQPEMASDSSRTGTSQNQSPGKPPQEKVLKLQLHA